MKISPVALVISWFLVVLPSHVVAQRSRPIAECQEVPTGWLTDPEHPNTDLVMHGEIVRRAKLVYPAALRGRKLEGVVSLRVVVGCTGRVDPKRVEVLRATDTAFVRPAIDAVLRSEYRPATYQGKRVAAPVEMVIRFKPEARN